MSTDDAKHLDSLRRMIGTNEDGKHYILMRCQLRAQVKAVVWALAKLETLTRLDVLTEDVRQVEIQRAHGGYEVTVHYWHVGEDRETHAHFGGDTIHEAVERAHAFALTLPRAWVDAEDLPLPGETTPGASEDRDG